MAAIYRDGYASLLESVIFTPSGGQFGGGPAPEPFQRFFGIGDPTPFGGPFSLGGAVSVWLPFLGDVELFRARVFGELFATFGLDVTASFDPGSIDAVLPYELALAIPELDAVDDDGQIVSIIFEGRSDFDADSGFTTSFPSLRFQLDLVAALDMMLATELGVAGNNATFVLADFSAATRIPLISVDTARQTATGDADPINVFGLTSEELLSIAGLDPAYDVNGNFAGISIPLNTFASSPEAEEAPRSDVEEEGDEIPEGDQEPELDFSGIDLGSLAILVPSINTVSRLVDGVFVTDPTRKLLNGSIVEDLDQDGVNIGEGNRDDLVVLTLDVDGILTYATGGAFPPLELELGASGSIGGVLNFGASFHYNLFDVELEAALPLVQEFTLTPALRTKLSFFDLEADGSKGAAKFIDVVQIERQLVYDPTGVFQDAAVEARLRELAATNGTFARDLELFVNFADGIPGSFTGQTGSIGGRMVQSTDGGATWQNLETDTVLARSAPLLGEDQTAELDLSGIMVGYRIIRGSGTGAQTEIIPIAFDPTDSLYRSQVVEIVSPLQSTPFLPDIGVLNLRYDGDTTFVEVETQARPMVTNRTGLEFDLSLLLSGLAVGAAIEASVDVGPLSIGAGLGFDFGPLFREAFPLLSVEIIDLYNRAFHIQDSHVTSFVLGAPAPPPDFGTAIVGTPGADTLDGTTGDDQIIGLAGDDVLNGLAGDDTISPGEGAATVEGGEGEDILDFSDIESRMIGIDLTETIRAGDRVGVYLLQAPSVPPGFVPYRVATLENTAQLLGAETVFTGIERIRLTEAADLVELNAAPGLLGYDVVIEMLEGNDFAWLRDSQVVLLMGDGNDVVEFVPLGNSTGLIDGGAGEDWLILTPSASLSVPFVDLELGEVAGGMAITGFENLGSRMAAGVLMAGDAGNNRIEGRSAAGADTLLGRGGNDTLDGGGGNDLLIGGPGADSMLGGAGADTVSYTDAPTSVFIDLDVGGVGRGYRGEAQGDVLTGIEHVVGTAFEDILIGASAAETLDGGDGDDRLAAQNGADLLRGGAGNDLLARALLDNAGSPNVTGNKTYDGGADFDIVAFEVNNDFLTGTVGGRARYKAITEGGLFPDTIGTEDRNVTFDWRVEDTPYLSARLGEGGADGTAQIIAPALRSQIWLTSVSGSGRFDYTHSGFLGIETGWNAGYAPVGAIFSGYTRSAVIGVDIPLPRGPRTQNQYLDQYNGDDNIIRSSYSGEVLSVSQVTSLRSSAAVLSTDTLRDVEGVIGTQNNDRIFGNAADNALYGDGGDDYIEGGAGNDMLGFGEGERLSNNFSFPSIPSFPGGGFLGPTGVASLLSQLRTLDPDATTTSASPRVNVGEVKIGVSSAITDFGSFLWGGAGVDTLDLRFDRGLSFYPSVAPTARALVDLDAAPSNTTISTVTGLRVVYGNADWLNSSNEAFEHATLFGIENVIGSAQADTINGDAKDNVIEGMAGGDLMNGRAGFDTLSYALAPAGVALNLVANIFSLGLDNQRPGKEGSGHAAGDRASGFERFLGSDHADTALLEVPPLVLNPVFSGGWQVDVDVLVTLGDGTTDIQNQTVMFQLDYFYQDASAYGAGHEIDLGAGNDSFESTGSAAMTVRLGAGDDTARLRGVGLTLDGGDGDDIVTIGGGVDGPFEGVSPSERTNLIEGGEGTDTVRFVGDNFTTLILTSAGAHVLELGPLGITPASLTPLELLALQGIVAVPVDNSPIDLLALPNVSVLVNSLAQGFAIHELTGIEYVEIGGEVIRLDSVDPVVDADRALIVAEDARDPFALGAKAPAAEVAAGALYRVVDLPEGAALLRPDDTPLGIGDTFAAADLAALKVVPGQSYGNAAESFVFASDGAAPGTPDRIVTLPPQPKEAGVALGIDAPYDPLGHAVTIEVTEMPTAGTLFYLTPDPALLALGMTVLVEQAVSLGDLLTPEQLAGLYFRGPQNGSGDLGGFAYVADTGLGFRELVGTSEAESADAGVDVGERDGRAGQRIAIAMTAVNDAPDIASLLYPLSPGGTLDGFVVGSDPEGDAFTFSLVAAPALGTLSFDADGRFTYLQDAALDFDGAGFLDDFFTVRAIENAGGLASTAQVQVLRIVNPATWAPIAFDVTRPDVFFDDEGNPIPLGGLGTDDEVIGHAGKDELFGFGGNDVVRGLDSADTLEGGTGNDTIFGDGGDDLLSGRDGGANQLFGGPGADTLLGGDGDDRLAGGAGIDSMAGGTGNDTYIVDGLDAAVQELPDEGRDRVVANFSYTLPDHVEDLALTGAAPINGTGNALDNLLIGNGAANLLSGEAGADTLDGGLGADTLVGGAGNDTYIGDPGDVLVELPGGGIDTVRSLVTYRLQAQFENLVLLGNADIDGTGNNLDNLIMGNGAGNVLAGGLGADTLIGGGGTDRLIGGVGVDHMEGSNGSDVYVVDVAGDVVIEYENGGFDRVTSFITYALPDHVENLLLLGTDPLDGFGNALGNIINGNAAANRLVGGDGNDRLDGGSGADTLEGGTGNDVYIIDDAGDLVVELPGEGVDTVQSRMSYTLTEAVENLLLVGAAALEGIGNAENNRLTGNAEANLLRGLDGDDTLNGLAGADTLQGGAGNDRLVGGPGDDLLIGGAGDDSLLGGAGADSFRFDGLADTGDAITDFAPGQDLILISAAGFGGILPTGTLPVGNFASDAPDAAVAQFVYSAATGVLAWDEDGSGAAAAVTLATLINRPVLTADDVFVIA